MFDIGFIEMLVVGLILLLVVGPERLPEVARTVGGWVHQAKQYTEAMKSELDRDINLSELEREAQDLKDLDRQTRQATDTKEDARKDSGGGSEEKGAARTDGEVGEAGSTGAADTGASEAPAAANEGEEPAAEAGESDPGGAGPRSSPEAEEQAASDMERELQEDDEKRGDDHRG